MRIISLPVVQWFHVTRPRLKAVTAAWQETTDALRESERRYREWSMVVFARVSRELRLGGPQGLPFKRASSKRELWRAGARRAKVDRYLTVTATHAAAAVKLASPEYDARNA